MTDDIVIEISIGISGIRVVDVWHKLILNKIKDLDNDWVDVDVGFR